ncbi:hypothetical protein [Haloarchaeobius sp. FL176]|uniref:hypothetical protein n=1 Tax=Haloarchaeobius sp. FL176 TaxID=2967129 RepID=UPI002148733F|nr:hypothetical protein [Haloarchaeobius sp. FL176]
MFDHPELVLGAVALLINGASTAAILVRDRVNPDAYDVEGWTFRTAAKHLVARGVGLAVSLVFLFVLVGASPDAVGLGPESITPKFAVAGLVTGAGLVLAAVASSAAVDRFGWDATSAVWATLRPDSPLEWAVYLPASWLSATADTTLYVVFVVGGLTTGRTPVALGLAVLTALVAGTKGLSDGPGTAVWSSVTYLVVGVAFVLTRSWLVVAVAVLVNNGIFGFRTGTAERDATAVTSD